MEKRSFPVSLIFPITHFYSTNAFFWVVDAAAVNRMDESRIELHNFASMVKFKEASVIVFANKSDLANAVDAQTIAKKLDLEVCLRRMTS